MSMAIAHKLHWNVSKSALIKKFSKGIWIKLRLFQCRFGSNSNVAHFHFDYLKFKFWGSPNSTWLKEKFTTKLVLVLVPITITGGNQIGHASVSPEMKAGYWQGCHSAPILGPVGFSRGFSPMDSTIPSSMWWSAETREPGGQPSQVRAVTRPLL